MREEHINGLGSAPGGQYERIVINGLGKIKGDVTALEIQLNGMSKLKGNVQTETLNNNGFFRIPRGGLRVKKLAHNGLMKVRRGDIAADEIRSCGALICTGEINADVFESKGVCSAARLYGDSITLRAGAGKDINSLGPFNRMFYGRRVENNRSVVDELECTALIAERLTAREVRVNQAVLRDHCRIEVLHCDGEADIDSTCEIGKIISN